MASNRFAWIKTAGEPPKGRNKNSLSHRVAEPYILLEEKERKNRRQ